MRIENPILFLAFSSNIIFDYLNIIDSVSKRGEKAVILAQPLLKFWLELELLKVL